MSRLNGRCGCSGLLGRCLVYQLCSLEVAGGVYVMRMGVTCEENLIRSMNSFCI